MHQTTEAFVRHLTVERGLSPRSVRAYAADIDSLVEYVSRRGRSSADQIALADLRGWLALQQTSGRARSTVARKASAARTFTSWIARTGRAATDAGSRLARPKAHRTLPQVLGPGHVHELMASAADRAENEADPVSVRDL